MNDSSQDPRLTANCQLSIINYQLTWKLFTTWQKIVLPLILVFHLSLLCSVSNRGDYGSRFFGFWRPFAWDTHGWLARGGDFFAVYEAGHQALLGRAVYRVQPEMNRLPRSESHMRAPYVATFRYPPVMAYTLAALLNIFPPDLSYKFWVLCNEALLVLGIALTLRHVKRPQTGFYVICAWLAFYPMHIEFYLGQFSFFMGFLWLCVALGILSGREKLATDWWGVSLFVKAYSLPFALYFFFRKQLRRPICWILLLVLTTIIYFAIFPSDAKLFYERGIAGRLFAGSGKNAGEKKDVAPKSPELYWGSMGVQRGVIALCRLVYLKRDAQGRFLVPYWAHYILYLVMLFPIPFLWMAVKDKGRDPIIILTLFALAWFFWYYDTWEHHYTMLLPIFALLVASEIITGRRALVIYILLAMPSLWIIFSRPETNPLYPHSPTTYFLLETLYYLIKPTGIIYLFIHLWRISSKPNDEGNILA